MDIFTVIYGGKLYFYKLNFENEFEILSFEGEEYFDISDENYKKFKENLLLKLNKSFLNDFNLYLIFSKEMKKTAKFILAELFDEGFKTVFVATLEEILKRYFIDTEEENAMFINQVWRFEEKENVVFKVDEESRNVLRIEKALFYFFYEIKVKEEDKEKINKHYKVKTKPSKAIKDFLEQETKKYERKGK